MEGLSQELQRELLALERKRDQYLKQLETADDGVRHRRFLRLLAVVDDRIWTKSLALQATYQRRHCPTSVEIEGLGDIVEVEIKVGEPEPEGVAFEIVTTPEDIEEAATRLFRWPTAPYPIVRELEVDTQTRPR